MPSKCPSRLYTGSCTPIFQPNPRSDQCKTMVQKRGGEKTRQPKVVSLNCEHNWGRSEEAGKKKGGGSLREVVHSTV